MSLSLLPIPFSPMPNNTLVLLIVYFLLLCKVSVDIFLDCYFLLGIVLCWVFWVFLHLFLIQLWEIWPLLDLLREWVSRFIYCLLCFKMNLIFWETKVFFNLNTIIAGEKINLVLSFLPNIKIFSIQHFTNLIILLIKSHKNN